MNSSFVHIEFAALMYLQLDVVENCSRAIVVAVIRKFHCEGRMSVVIVQLIKNCKLRECRRIHLCSIDDCLAQRIKSHLILGAIRMLMMDVPSPTTQGESVELICSYELDEDKLYSVKWYKDDVEFYRYVPNDWPPGQFLPLQGVRVDLSKSGSQSVYLRHVDLNSAGTYRCEVSAEAPEFQTVEAEKPMKVFVLPTEGPTITGGRSKYRIGDTVYVNCTSSKSKPAATLRWYINDELATSDSELEHSTTLHSDGLETSSLSLKFTVNEMHFRRGNMKLKCTATISRVYTMSNEELVFGSGLRQQASGLHITEKSSHVQNTSPRLRSVHWNLSLLLCATLLKSLLFTRYEDPHG